MVCICAKQYSTHYWLNNAGILLYFWCEKNTTDKYGVLASHKPLPMDCVSRNRVLSGHLTSWVASWTQGWVTYKWSLLLKHSHNWYAPCLEADHDSSEQVSFSGMSLWAPETQEKGNKQTKKETALPSNSDLYRWLYFHIACSLLSSTLSTVGVFMLLIIYMAFFKFAKGLGSPQYVCPWNEVRHHWFLFFFF